ncbi:SAM-dependent methyltransferase [Tepiditoga spiralis]|uniref:SAM-dependent methyltransferase n=1 Tax=Tepiditoga spiralis TaxID=2108365 RepID=A0A7G1GBV0_9BACT|nr:methyltransferase domain-containing protein [Tepiditoga spiralis]BBE32002.1 SAM-dependent methyltransferase [Tepiditoga spiralis]
MIEVLKKKFIEIDNVYRKLKIKAPSKTHMPNHASSFLILTSTIKNNMKVIEFGSGTGHVSICLSKLYNINITGIELQKDLFTSSIKNAAINDSKVNFINDDVKNIKKYFLAESFDYIISNPPHYSGGIISKNVDRKTARTLEKNTLINFLDSTKYLLKNKKICNFVIHPSIFTDFINIAKSKKLEPQEMYIGYGKKDGEAQLISIIMRKNGGTNFKIHPPIYLISSN